MYPPPLYDPTFGVPDPPGVGGGSFKRGGDGFLTTNHKKRVQCNRGLKGPKVPLQGNAVSGKVTDTLDATFVRS